MFGHELLYVVVAAVLQAVDVSWPAVPASPLPIADPTPGEGRDLDAIGMQTVTSYCRWPSIGPRVLKRDQSAYSREKARRPR